MKDTEALIRELSGEPAPAQLLPAPAQLAAGLLVACLVWGVLGQFYLGLRPDVGATLTHAALWVEIAGRALLLASSLVASVLLMYPDAYQHRALTRLPFVVFGLLLALCVTQLLVQADWRLQDATDMHGITCTLSIAAVAVAPSALVMAMLGRGAVVLPRLAGSLAALSGTALGGLVVRLHEINDSMVHVLVWHDLPSALFSLLGVLIGRRLLKW